MKNRIGIFGGSFDPVHLGHLWIAEAAREQLGLNQVRWIPAATSPLKPGGPVAGNHDRLQMVRLATSGNTDFVVDDRELVRGEISYTVDTVAEMKTEFPEDDFFLIIGSDSLASFDRWHQPERLLEMVMPAVIARGGEPPIDFSILDGLTTVDYIDEITKHVVEMPQIEVSSTDLRQRIGAGQGVRYRVPAAVEAMIQASGIYR